jgi:hypothetical protein
VVEAQSSSYDRKNLNPERRSTRQTARDARVGPFHIPSDPRKTQNEFALFVVGLAVNDRMLKANRICIHHHQKKRWGCSVWTSMGGHSIARARWAYSVMRENRMAIVAPD